MLRRAYIIVLLVVYMNYIQVILRLCVCGLGLASIESASFGLNP